MAEKVFFCPFADEWRRIKETPKDEHSETRDGTQKSGIEETKISLTK